MSTNLMAKAGYYSTKNLYACSECLVVRLIPDTIINSTEVQTTAKLTDTNTFLEITVLCPICQKTTKHFHCMEANIPGNAANAALSRLHRE